MKSILTIFCIATLSSCGLFDKGDEVSIPKQPVDRGVCYKLPEDRSKLPEGAKCKDGDVWCTSDNHCHSKCEKCPPKK